MAHSNCGQKRGPEIGLDLEAAAVRYVRKLDDEIAKANRPNYLAIVEQAERDRENSGN